MTKSQLVAKLADAGGMSRKQVDELVNEPRRHHRARRVKKGESVKIPGLGIFRLRKMKARVGRAIRRPARRSRFPARKKVGFSVAKSVQGIGARQGQVRELMRAARSRAA